MAQVDTQVEDLATRLRLARSRYGLSQRKLAKQSGVSNATISLIEKGRYNPTVGTLFKLVSALPMSIAEFWGLELGEPEQVFFSFEELTRIKHNKVTYWIVGDGSPGGSMTFQYERYEPGMDGREVQTDEEAEVAGYVIEGAIEVTVGEQSRILRAGDAYRFSTKIPHRFRVVGKQPATSVSCTIPPVF